MKFSATISVYVLFVILSEFSNVEGVMKITVETPFEHEGEMYIVRTVIASKHRGRARIEVEIVPRDKAVVTRVKKIRVYLQGKRRRCE